MKLEDLKYKATTSERAFIHSVEMLVRSEYDRDMIEKEIHNDLKKRIDKQVYTVLKKHNIVDRPSWDINRCAYHELDYMRRVLYELGDAIRLELKPEDDEIR